MRLVCVLVVLCGLASLGMLQAYGQCKLIVGDQGSVFLTFERTAMVAVEASDKKISGAIFQIHNNSSCPILLTTGDASSFYKPLLPNPTVMQRMNREVDWVLPEGALVPSFQYRYQSRKSNGNSVGGDSFFEFELIGGRYVRFEVPFTHLDPTFANRLDVEFDYVWESDNKDCVKRSNVTNLVTFWIGSLPDDVEMEIKKALY